MRRRAAALVLCLVAGACADPEGEAASWRPVEEGARVPARRAEAPDAHAPPAPLLGEDCGGWTPAPDLLLLAARLGDPPEKQAALAEIDALPPARRIDVLRAGLRLADPTAARACAARLSWREIDGWECGRCVDLLVPDVLRPGTEADLDELRSYLGSADLERFFREAPPLPWAEDATFVVGQLHRLLRADNLHVYVRLAGSSDPTLARTAWGELAGTLGDRTDLLRDEIERRAGRADDGRTPAGPGLPVVLRQSLRLGFTEDGDGASEWTRRWLHTSPLGPGDVELLLDAVNADPPTDAVEPALLLLGRADDAASFDALREIASGVDGLSVIARLALVRRRDPEALAWAASAAGEDGDALGALMEADPERARERIFALLLGPDDDAALRALETLASFASPGADSAPLGHPDWRRTSLAGLDDAAIGAGLSARRLGALALALPVCRTRRVAAAALRVLTGADLDPTREPDVDVHGVGAFLESADADALRRALRPILAAGGPGGGTAHALLLALGDPATDAALIAGIDRGDPDALRKLARTRTPAVRTFLEQVVADASSAGDVEALGTALAHLAVFHGFPEDAAGAFGSIPPTADTVRDVRDGRPVDALMGLLDGVLAAAVSVGGEDSPSPEQAGDVGAVRDPRVRGWLVAVRARRELGATWYATAQLAAWGDPSARAEYWKAVRDGRYRILDDAGEPFVLTLGHDLGATLPHWIAETESNCCRAVVAASVLEATLGFDSDPTIRTDVVRAREIWDAADAGLVRSRILGHWVAAPR